MAVAAATFGAAGCATSGPLHVYSAATPTAALITDHGESDAHEVSSYLAPGEEMIGFAYDPFTDHFFLRLAPGNRIRVVDRPAQTIKREIELRGVGEPNGGDFALRPRDGHLFVITRGARVVELTRFGEHVRDIWLVGTSGTPHGFAYDFVHDRLLTLDSTGRRISIHSIDGARLGEISLEQPVGDSLAFDGTRREFYAPLTNRGMIGVFDEQGRLTRTLPFSGKFVDVGERSFLRLF
jgi:hypothetical protein